MNRGPLWLEHASAQRRVGVKGPRAAELLRQLGCEVPATPNSWAPLRARQPDGSPDVIARLGNTEFFLEESGEAPMVAALEQAAVGPGVEGAWPVLREDCALVLGGERASDALAEVCNVDFASMPAARPVFMTLMAGVSVLVLRGPFDPGAADATAYRIWCDPSFGPYLWETLGSTMNTNLKKTSGRAG